MMRMRSVEELGVPVLPVEEQLRIHVLGEDVGFVCVGKPMGPMVT